MSAQSTRAPRSSARIDPIARLILDITKRLPRPDPATQHQAVERPLAIVCETATSDRWLLTVSLL